LIIYFINSFSYIHYTYIYCHLSFITLIHSLIVNTLIHYTLFSLGHSIFQYHIIGFEHKLSSHLFTGTYSNHIYYTVHIITFIFFSSTMLLYSIHYWHLFYYTHYFIVVTSFVDICILLFTLPIYYSYTYSHCCHITHINIHIFVVLFIDILFLHIHCWYYYTYYSINISLLIVH